MSSNLELISDGDGLAVVGRAEDVDRFLLDLRLDQAPSERLDLHRLSSAAGTAGAAAQIASQVAENSGRWIKLTAESAEAVNRYGLMPTKVRGVSHAMIGKPGDIQQWLQVAQGPASMTGNPLALAMVGAMMQQRALQQQMDEIVEYLQEINEKIDDILRAQKDAVLADMIGVDLVVEEALTVRDQVGRVSEVTWSKVQATSMTIARTQAYAILQLDAAAERLGKKTDLGEVARATREAEPTVREWLAVLARCFQLQDGACILELDRVLDAAPEDLDQHRLGLATARQNRLDLITRTTSRLLSQMDETVRRANAKVLFNPFDSPAAVRSSSQIAERVLGFRGLLGIETSHETADARRWRHAAGDAVTKAVTSGTEGAVAAKRLGEQSLDRATEVFRAVDLDGDGIPDKPRAAAAAEEAGAALKTAASGVAGAVGTLLQRKQAPITADDEAHPNATKDEQEATVDAPST